MGTVVVLVYQRGYGAAWMASEWVVLLMLGEQVGHVAGLRVSVRTGAVSLGVLEALGLGIYYCGFSSSLCWFSLALRAWIGVLSLHNWHTYNTRVSCSKFVCVTGYGLPGWALRIGLRESAEVKGAVASANCSSKENGLNSLSEEA